jgi:hypothetical protein
MVLSTMAFIIFGLKRREKDHGAAVPARCTHCQNNVLLHPYGWRTWFHIFWIPLIPWIATRTLACPVCLMMTEVDNGTYDDATKLADKAEAAADGRLTNGEFWTAVEKHDHIYERIGSDGSQTLDKSMDPYLEEGIEENIERV